MTIDRSRLDELDSNAKRELLARLLREKAAGVGETVDLSFGQEALFFLNELSPQAVAYNVAFCGRIRAQVDSDRLEAAFLKLLERHQALRCTFPPSEGKQKQRVGPVPSRCLEVLDASGWSEEELRAQENEFSRRPFDLAAGPLFRAFLFTRNDTDHVLLITAHHIVFDASSLGIVLSDLALLYDRGPSAPLPALAGSYADFVKWQREMVDSGEGRQAWEVWRSKLEGFLTPVDLPGDRARPGVQSFSGATHHFELPAGLCQGFRTLARAENATPYMVLATAYHALLSRYSGAAQVPIAMPLSGRGRQEFENTVGYFINPVVLCAPIDPGATFRQHLAQMRETVIEAQRYGDFPFPELVKRLQPERDTSRSPLCQVMLNMVKTTQIGATGALSDAGHRVQMRLGSLPLETFPLDQQEGQFDLDLDLLDTGASMPASLKYSTDLFDADRIERMAGHFVTLLAAAIAEPGQRISDLPMLTEAERTQILVDWNATAKPYPIAPIHRMIEDQVKRNPDATALVFEGRPMSYGELNRRANQLAHHLRGLGVGPDTLVAISVERSFEMVVGLVGILKAGGAYVPVDPGYPADRQAYMIEDSRAPVLLTQSRLAEGLKNTGSRLVLLDTEWEEIARCGDENLEGGAGPENLAYVIYTSGSTGRPKGAMNEHRAVSNRLLWMQDEYRLTESDRVLQKTPFSFDVSVWEFFWPLITGAVLVIAAPEGHKDPDYLVRLVQEQGITTMHFVPSMLRSFLDAENVAECRSLKRVICSGEALPFDLQERFFALMGAELHNLYGPTEAAVDVTYWACQRESARKLVPIGRPVANTRMYILDTSFKPLPVGVPGELYIGGVQVGRGYWGRAELTAERFLADPFCPGGRIYKTGDLARWLPDGAIEYLGRNDFQVKIRGFRIELGEIEAALAEQPAVGQAVVCALEDVPGDVRLVAYLVARPQAAIDVGELRELLRVRLPEYMVPSAFVVLEAIPLNPSGKVDRKALPKPERERDRATEYLAPRNATEQTLAAVFAEVLKLERIGIQDDFFEAGGHSLLATQVIARIRAALGISLPVRQLFERRTVAGLAEAVALELLKTTGPAHEKVSASIPRVSRQGRRVDAEGLGKDELSGAKQS
jgi:amino acid adenylation domain-containing protein